MIRRFSGPVTTFAFAALIAAAGASVSTHHSFAVFDMTAQKSIEGTVKKVDWTNPHVWVWVDVPTTGGASETYGFEGMSPNYLERRGWSRNTIKVGDKLSITFHPLKNGDKGGSFQSAQRPNGEVLGMTPPISDK